jgi:hypothetical protein
MATRIIFYVEDNYVSKENVRLVISEALDYFEVTKVKIKHEPSKPENDVWTAYYGWTRE